MQNEVHSSTASAAMDSNSSTITMMLNGKAHVLSRDSTVHTLMESLSLQQQAVAVAVNQTVIPRSRWTQHELKPNDRVEVVHAIGGG